MFFKGYRRFIVFFICLIIFVIQSSCQDRLESDVVVYSSNFNALDLDKYENGRVIVFEGNTLLGNYNNEELSLTVSNLPRHNILRITVDLWIHDSWDGNVDDGIGGPDFWYMEVDGAEVFRTTFSNSPCESLFCLRQSYPNVFFRQNDPRTGAFQTNLPGLCLRAGLPNNTTRYRIVRLVSHVSDSVKITLGDELLQTNSPDPLCDESWSVGEIQVSALIVN